MNTIRTFANRLQVPSVETSVKSSIDSRTLGRAFVQLQRYIQAKPDGVFYRWVATLAKDFGVSDRTIQR